MLFFEDVKKDNRNAVLFIYIYPENEQQQQQ